MAQKIDYPATTDMKLIFGDWTMATLRGIKVDFKRNVMVFVFVPDPHMRWVHQIPDADYDETINVIKREYPREDCHCVNPDPKYQTWFLFCDYNGNKCDPAIGINQELLVQNNSLRNERDAWMTSAILIPLKLRKAIKYPEEIKTELLKEMKEQKKIMGSDLGLGGEKEQGVQ